MTDDQKTSERAVNTQGSAFKGLGRGLAALIGEKRTLFKGDPTQVDEGAGVRIEQPSMNSSPAVDFKKISTKTNMVVGNISMDKIRPNPAQPRKVFDEDALQELSLSIQSRGLLHPVTLRLLHDDEKTDGYEYEIVAGERRWRACQILGMKEIPAFIREMTTQDVFEIAIIENIQREGLNPIEESKAYNQLMEEFHYKQDDLAKLLGKSRSHVANVLRLVTLPSEVQTLIMEGKLTQGHAKVLVGKEDAYDLAQKIIEEKLSVRDTESLIREKKTPFHAAGQQHDDNTLEDDILHLIIPGKIEDIQDEGTLISHRDRLGSHAHPMVEQHDNAKKMRKKAMLPSHDASQEETNQDIEILRHQLEDELGMDVSVSFVPKDNKGSITIYYQNLIQLDDLCHRIIGGGSDS